MSVLQAEVYRAFRSLDTEDDTARNFSKRDADIEATRKDVGAIKDQLVGIKLDIAGVKGEQAIMRWLMGFLLAMVTTLLFKAFAH